MFFSEMVETILIDDMGNVWFLCGYFINSEVVGVSISIHLELVWVSH